MKKYSKILKGSSVVILAAAFIVSGFFVATPQALANSADITKINFTSPAQTVNINSPSGILTTQTQNASSMPEQVSETTTLNLTSTSGTGQFSSSVDTWSPVTTLTMSINSANRNFYYRDPTAGTHTLTVSAEGKTWTVASQNIIVVPLTVNVSHSPSSPIAGQLVRISALATDGYLLANTKIYLDDVNVLTCDFSGEGFSSADCPFETTALSVGTHTYYAITTNSVGNTARDPLVGTKSLTVATPPNSPPVLASIGNKTIDELSTLTFTATASDPEGDSMTFSLNGTVPTGAAITPSGDFSWTPTETQGPGTYTFDVVVTDSNGGTDSETITVTVNEVNVAPTANDQSVTTNEDTATAITLTATDPDLPVNTLTYTIVIPPTNGSLGAIVNGVVTYTLTANLNGSDSFTFQVSDDGGAINSAPATVSITVTAVNDVPSFTKGADQTVDEDAAAQSIAGWATSISAGPADEVGQTLNFIVSNNNNVLFSAQPAIAVDGTLTYTPAANANGLATVTVSLQDNGGTANGGQDTSASQTFTITVTPVNDAPVISSVTITPADPKTNDILTANVTANDVDDDALTYNYQ
ncbi:MAG: Ig-like domain-containing protein, partial [Patescibacteria group bacterium]